MKYALFGELGRSRLNLAMLVPMLWLLGAAGLAPGQGRVQLQRTPLQLSLTDVLPNGNE